MTTQTSKTQALSFGGRSAKAMATFTALALIAMGAAINPAHADPRAQVGVDAQLGSQGYNQGYNSGLHQGYHEDQMLRADPIFRRIGFTRARIDRMADQRIISRFEARRFDQRLDEIAYDARLALSGPRTDQRLLVSADMRLERLSDRLDDTRFSRVDWRW